MKRGATRNKIHVGKVSLRRMLREHRGGRKIVSAKKAKMERGGEGSMRSHGKEYNFLFRKGKGRKKNSQNQKDKDLK